MGLFDDLVGEVEQMVGSANSSGAALARWG